MVDISSKVKYIFKNLHFSEILHFTSVTLLFEMFQSLKKELNFPYDNDSFTRNYVLLLRLSVSGNTHTHTHTHTHTYISIIVIISV